MSSDPNHNEDPETVFVADFLGIANMMSVEAIGPAEGGCEVKLGEFSLRACCGANTVTTENQTGAQVGS